MTGPGNDEGLAQRRTSPNAQVTSATLIHFHSTWSIEGQPRIDAATNIAVRAALHLDGLTPEAALVAIAGLLTSAERHMAAAS